MTATVKPPTFLPSYHDEESVRRIEYRQIGQTDMVVSPLSFGASSLGGVFRQTDDAESGERERRGECDKVLLQSGSSRRWSGPASTT